MARTAGAWLGLCTLAADALKGSVPVLVARWVTADVATEAATGLAAFLGHVFPITLGFAGGKGVATAAGVLTVLAPLAALCGVVVFALAFTAWRYVSVASMLGGLAATAASAALRYPASAVVAATLMMAVVLARHRGNVARLRAGVEPPFTLHKKQAPPTK